MLRYAVSIDEFDPAITWSTFGWDTIPVNPLSDSKGEVMHVSTSAGSYAAFGFSGTAVAAVFDMPENGLATFQIDNGTEVWQNYSSICDRKGPEYWQSGPLGPGYHTLTMTNMGNTTSFKLNYIDYQSLQATRSVPKLAIYIVVAVLATITFLYFVNRQVRRYLRRRELEEASFPDYMYPFNSRKRSSIRSTLHFPTHKMPSHPLPSPALTRLRSGPIDNISPSAIYKLSNHQPHHSASGELQYSFTRTIVPSTLETQIVPPHPQPLHFLWKAC